MQHAAYVLASAETKCVTSCLKSLPVLEVVLVDFWASLWYTNLKTKSHYFFLHSFLYRLLLLKCNQRKIVCWCLREKNRNTHFSFEFMLVCNKQLNEKWKLEYKGYGFYDIFVVINVNQKPLQNLILYQYFEKFCSTHM